MAVIDVQERIQQKSGDWDYGQGASYKRQYIVTTDDDDDGPLTVKNATGIPKEGAVWPEEAAVPGSFFKARCRKISVRRIHDAEKNTWLVDVDYNNHGQSFTIESTEKPWTMDPVISFSYAQSEKDFTLGFDVNDRSKTEPDIPVENSAGLPFVGMQALPEKLLVITIQRNENPRVFSYDSRLTYINTCNDAITRLIGKKFGYYTLFMADISASPEQDSKGNRYWKVVYQIIHDPKKFRTNTVDAGLKRLNLDPATQDAYPYVPITVGTHGGYEVTEPVPLGRDGQPAEKDEVVAPFNFYPYRFANWNKLHLPEGMTI